MSLNNEITNLVLQKQAVALQYLADMYGVSVQDIAESFRDVRQNPSGRPKSIQDVGLLQNLYKEGVSLQQLATKFNCSETTIRTYLDALGVKIVSKRRSSKLNKAEPVAKHKKSELSVEPELVSRLFSKGYSIDRLSAIFKVDETVLENILSGAYTSEKHTNLLESSSRELSTEFTDLEEEASESVLLVDELEAHEAQDGLSEAQILEVYADLTLGATEEELEEESVALSEIEAEIVSEDPILQELNDEDIERVVESSEYDEQKQKDFIRRMYLSGATVTTLASFCKSSPAKISGILQESNVPVKKGRPSGRTLPLDEVQKIWKHFVSETSHIVDSVASELNLTSSEVLSAANNAIKSESYDTKDHSFVSNSLIKVTPLRDKLVFIYLRSKGLTLDAISRADFDINNRRMRHTRFPTDVISRIIEEGIPLNARKEDIDSAQRVAEDYLSQNMRRRVRFDISTIEDHHYIADAYDLTPADLEYIVYLNQKQYLNVYEISDYVYYNIPEHQIREILKFRGIESPTRRKYVDRGDVDEIVEIRNETKCTAKYLAERFKLPEEKVLFFLDYFRCNLEDVNVYDQRGRFTGRKEDFIDTLRKCTGEFRQQFIKRYIETPDASVRSLIPSGSSVEDYRALLYIKRIPIRLHIEFPNKVEEPLKVVTAPPTAINPQLTIHNIRYGGRFKPLVEYKPVKKIEEPAQDVMQTYEVTDLKPFKGFSLLEIERILDLNKTFCLTPEEISFYELIGRTPEDIESVFEYKGVPVRSCLEVDPEKRSRIIKNLKRVSSLKQLADLHNLPIEKVKYLVRRKVIKTNNPENVSFDYVSEAKNILGVDLAILPEIFDLYQQERFSTAELAVYYNLGSRENVRRLLHDKLTIQFRLEEEFKPVEQLEEFGN